MNVAPRFECELPPAVRQKIINPHPPVMINLRIECRMPDFSRLPAKVKRLAGKAWKIVRVPVQVTAFICIMSALLVGLVVLTPGKPSPENQEIIQRALAKTTSDFSSPKPAYTPAPRATLVKNPWPQSENLAHEND
jgi:hypothetical protein